MIQYGDFSGRLGQTRGRERGYKCKLIYICLLNPSSGIIGEIFEKEFFTKFREHLPDSVFPESSRKSLPGLFDIPSFSSSSRPMRFMKS